MMWFDIWWKRRQRQTGLYQTQYFGCAAFTTDEVKAFFFLAVVVVVVVVFFRGGCKS